MTIYTLYFIPNTCSLAIHVALREIGAQFEIKNVAVPDGQPRSAEFLAINPRGNVPVLVWDGFVLREGSAILTWLLDTHQSPLLPHNGLERARALEWLMFANATLHPAYSRAFFLSRQIGADVMKSPLMDAALRMIQTHWDSVESHLSTHQWLAGDSITIADILITVIANWSGRFGKETLVFGSKTKELLKRVVARPSYQAAMQAEGVSYSLLAA